MAFQNTSHLQIITCPSCRGNGCTECDGFGVYAISQDRTLVFSLPPNLKIQERKKNKYQYGAKMIMLLFIFLLTLVFLLNLVPNQI